MLRLWVWSRQLRDNEEEADKLKLKNQNYKKKKKDHIEEDLHEVNAKRYTVWAMAVFNDCLIKRKKKKCQKTSIIMQQKTKKKLLLSIYASVQNSHGDT